MPSLYEGLANAALEGCAAGLPGDPLARRQRRRDRPPRRERLGDPHRAPGRAGARARGGAGHAGRAPRRDGAHRNSARDGAVRAAAEPRDRSDGGRVRRAVGGRSARMTAVAPVDFQNTVFDVLIAGSGFGGATAAYALSRAGLRVLLIERGGWPNRDETDWNGRAILLEGRYRGETPLLVRQEGATACGRDLPQRGRRRQLGLLRRRHAAAADHRLFALADLRTPSSSRTTRKRRRCSRSTDAPAKTPADRPARRLPVPSAGADRARAPDLRRGDRARASPVPAPDRHQPLRSARAPLPQLLHLRRVPLPDRRQERHDPDGAHEGRSDAAHHPGANGGGAPF